VLHFVLMTSLLAAAAPAAPAGEGATAEDAAGGSGPTDAAGEAAAAVPAEAAAIETVDAAPKPSAVRPRRGDAPQPDPGVFLALGVGLAWALALWSARGNRAAAP